MKNLTSAALSHCAYWAIDATAGHALWRQLQATDAASHRAEFDRARASYMSDEAKPSKPYRLENGVAVLSLSGVMTKAPNSMTYYGGGTATALLRWQIRKAVADEDVKSILLLVDSPGGSVAGTQDLADDISAAARKKPLDVYVEDQCCSAAYWAACGARKITANSTALIGSLGAMMAIEDSSDQAEMLGIKVLVYKTAELKGAGTPGTEITDTQGAMFQGIVDDFGAHFLTAIKAGRKFDDKKAAAIFNAEVFLADKALSLGLIDAIGSLDSVYADLAAEIELGSEDDCDASAKTVLGGSAAAGTANSPTTISASGGGTGPQLGAGTEKAPVKAGQGKPSMKQILIRTLAALGLNQMATALTAATSEEPEAMASVMAEQVQTEVRTRLENDPLTLACKANGIVTVPDLQKVLEMKALGESHLLKTRADAKAEAIRAYGSELGPQISAQVDSLPYSAALSMLNSWRAEADAKYGIGGNGEAPKRQTAPATSAAAAVDADATQQPQKAWDRLSASQQEQAIKMGHGKSDDAKEKFASNLLGLGVN